MTGKFFVRHSFKNILIFCVSFVTLASLACVPKTMNKNEAAVSNQSENLQNLTVQGPPRPAIESVTSELEKNLNTKQQGEILEILKDGPLTQSELQLIFAVAKTLYAEASNTSADLILFFARDSDPIFDAFRLISSKDPNILESTRRFFLNTYLYQNRDAFERYLEKMGVAPGKSMILFDTGFGGSNFRYLMTNLLQLGSEMSPKLSPREVILPLRPYLIASTQSSNWERNFYMLSEPSKLWEFIDDVAFPEVAISEQDWTQFETAGGNRRSFVEKLEDKTFIQKWEAHPREWLNNTPVLRAKDKEKQQEALKWQKQIAAYWLLKAK